MVDRTDLDALLIGALYGELTPADEARLTAHLASHPADRTALEDLTHTRDAVRASGLHAVWLEPPQAVSARVLQEAARRAPAAQASWFHRFVRSLTAHPALAAAMTIVLVAGVASTLYVRRADKFGEVSESDRAAVAVQSRVEQSAPVPTATAAPVVAPVPVPAAPSSEGSAAGGGDAPAAEATETGKNAAVALRESAKAGAPQKPVAKSRPPSGMVVDSRALEPKDLDEEAPRARTVSKLAKQDDSALRRQTASGPPAGALGGNPSTLGEANQAPAQGFAAPAAAAPPPPPAPAHAEIADDKSDGAPSSWAQRQRDQVIAYVHANNCRAAAAAAVEIYNRAPDFYESNIATDREIKPCLPYVTSERARVDRARAAKRDNAEPSSQAAPAASDPSPSATPPVRK